MFGAKMRVVNLFCLAGVLDVVVVMVVMVYLLCYSHSLVLLITIIITTNITISLTRLLDLLLPRLLYSHLVAQTALDRRILALLRQDLALCWRYGTLVQ
jgi:hypothetical protein